MLLLLPVGDLCDENEDETGVTSARLSGGQDFHPTPRPS